MSDNKKSLQISIPTLSVPQNKPAPPQGQIQTIVPVAQSDSPKKKKIKNPNLIAAREEKSHKQD